MKTLMNNTNKSIDDMHTSSSPLKRLLPLLRAQVRLFILGAQIHEIPPILAYHWMKENGQEFIKRNGR